MEISRRKFFFFGLAAGVGLLLPDSKIQLDDNELKSFEQFLYGAENEYHKVIPGTLYGIPYHYDNSTAGTWLGFSRK